MAIPKPNPKNTESEYFLNKLRADQRMSIQEMKKILEGNKLDRNTCWHILGATGSGKTYAILLSLAALSRRGRSVIVHCPSVEVLTELDAKFREITRDCPNEFVTLFSKKDKGAGQNTEKWFRSIVKKLEYNKKVIIFVTTHALNGFCDRMGRKEANRFFKENLNVDFMVGDEAHRWGIIIGNELNDRGYELSFSSDPEQQFDAAWLRTVLEAFDDIPKFAATATMTNSQLQKHIEFTHKKHNYVFKNQELARLLVSKANKMPMLISATHGPYMSPAVDHIDTDKNYIECTKIEKIYDIATCRKQVVEAVCKTVNEYQGFIEQMKIDCPEFLAAQFGDLDSVPYAKAIVCFKNRDDSDEILSLERFCDEQGVGVAWLMPNSEGVPQENQLDDFREPFNRQKILFTKMLANEGININNLICVGIARSNNIKNEVDINVVQLIGRIVRAFFPLNTEQAESALKRRLTEQELRYYYLFSSPVVHAINSKTNNLGIEHSTASDTFSKQTNEIIRLDNTSTTNVLYDQEEYYPKFQRIRDERIDEFMNSDLAYRKVYDREDMREIVLNVFPYCPITNSKDRVKLQVAHLVPHADIRNKKLNFDETDISLYLTLRADVHLGFDAGQFYFEQMGDNILQIKHSNNLQEDVRNELIMCGAFDGRCIQLPYNVNKEAIEYRKKLVTA